MPRFRETLTSRAFAILLATVALVAGTVTPVGAADPVRTLVPIGSDYQPDTLQQFARAAADHDSDGQVVILVLPITYSVSATSSTNGERQQNLTLADGRRGLVEDACEAVANAQTCLVQLVPALVRADAFLASNLALFTSDVDGMYILGGDQTVAMGVVADTPMEERMSALYAAGAVVGGNSAGDAVQSVNMINGYVGNNGPAESMRQGAVDLWTSTGVNDPSRGLIFGLTKAIDEQHVFEYGRTGRALNVAMTSGLPVIGMDAATGSTMLDETTLTEVVGFTSGLVIDPISYDASYRFAGPNSTLSVRDVATHLLPPSGFGYDLDALRPTVGGVASSKPSIAGRSYPAFTTPSGAGSLFLAGGLGSAPAGPAAQAFVTRAGGGGARIVVLAAGYRRATDAQADAKAIAGALQSGVVAPVRWIVLDGKTDVAAANAAVADATGIYVTAPDPSRVMAGLRSSRPCSRRSGAAGPVVVPRCSRTTRRHRRWVAGLPWTRCPPTSSSRHRRTSCRPA